MPLSDIWPVLGICVRTSDVELFVPDQDTLESLACLAADGIYDPQNQYLPRIPVGGWEAGGRTSSLRRLSGGSFATTGPRSLTGGRNDGT